MTAIATVTLGRFLVESWIDVEKSSYHHLSQNATLRLGPNWDARIRGDLHLFEPYRLSGIAVRITRLSCKQTLGDLMVQRCKTLVRTPRLLFCASLTGFGTLFRHFVGGLKLPLSARFHNSNPNKTKRTYRPLTCPFRCILKRKELCYALNLARGQSALEDLRFTIDEIARLKPKSGD
jgi:hypothetical protein